MGSTLREALESAVSAQEEKESQISEAPAVVDVVESTTDIQKVATEATVGETDTQRAERIRDEKGRFAEGKAEKTPIASQGKLPTSETPQAVAPEVKRPARPSSWKKDYWEQWDKLDPKVAEYINQREGEYAKGVSTYKQEWDSAKPFLDAVAPYKQLLEQHRIDPAAHVSELMRIHHTLVTGSAQEKLGIVARIIQEQKLPIEQLLVQGQDGRLYLNQQLPQQARPQAPQLDVRKEVQQVLLQERARQSLAEFEYEAPSKYQHYETVKSDMALLLDAGKAQDLKSAYDMALRLHDDLWQSEQEAKSKANEAARLDAQRKAVSVAKGSAISVKSATPASAGAAPKKGLRSQLEDAYDQHASGRV